MTHAELVNAAAKYLKYNCRCGVVFTELVSAAGEIPDAIGFRMDYSIVIECKASKNDFLQDAKKRYRIHSWMGMGSYRYYMCPEGLLKPGDMPDKWGLIYVTGAGKRILVRGHKGNMTDMEFLFTEKCLINEYSVMYSALRRLRTI